MTQVDVRVELYRQGERRGTLTGAGGGVGAVVSGQVTVDEDAASRRTLEMTVDTRRLPSGYRETLAPPTEAEVFVSDPGSDWIRLGMFGLSRPETTRGPGPVELTLEGYDRSRRISNTPWPETYTVSGGSDCDSVIRAGLEDRDPAAELIVAEPSDATTTARRWGPPSDSDPDPWRDLSEVAESYGRELFVDPRGRYVLRPVPDPNDAQATFGLTVGDGRLIETAQQLDETPGYNAVTVRAEGGHLATVLTKTVEDDDPTSPTYVGTPISDGGWGKRVKMIPDQLAKSQSQVDDRAEAEFRKLSGLTRTVSATVVRDASRDAGEVGTLTDPQAGIEVRGAVRSLQIPLGPEPMSVDLRTRR